MFKVFIGLKHPQHSIFPSIEREDHAYFRILPWPTIIPGKLIYLQQISVSM